MKIKAQVGMVINLDKCIGCHTCSVTCKNTWTNRPGAEYMWWNNVETKPGIGYPKEWENQAKYQGGWVLKKGKLELRSGTRAKRLVNIFYNPNQPTIDDYYEPWKYNYEKLINSPEQKHQPVARPKSAITGKDMELTWGPNWEDDLAGAHKTGKVDQNIKGMEESIKLEFEDAFMLHLPRICEHCINPACVSSCPSGAMYKRNEDGIVLVDQEACRAWRFCVSNCPYKKVYFNWKTNKAEKCTLCFPRLELGMPTVCSETCVGRTRYIGVMLYDADRVEEAASVAEQQLYQSQLNLFLDPNDPHVIEQARAEGIPEDWLVAAQKSPIYKMIIDWKIALPLHPEYRTLPMVWYVPPLSPLTKQFSSMSTEEFFPEIDNMRIPIQYLANLLTAGDTERVRNVLKKLSIMRSTMRNKNLGKSLENELIDELGLNTDVIGEMYHLLAIAKYEDRFVIPKAHHETISSLLQVEQGACGLNFSDGPGSCGVI